MEQEFETMHLDSDDEIRSAFAVMRELRPHLADEESFLRQVARQISQAYRLLAVRAHGKTIGVAGYRIMDNLLYGKFMYVDDLVVTASLQRHRIGEGLLDAARRQAVLAGCRHFVLDTGLHMPHAQRFYFRLGLLARGMHFVQPLPADEA